MSSWFRKGKGNVFFRLRRSGRIVIFQAITCEKLLFERPKKAGDVVNNDILNNSENTALYSFTIKPKQKRTDTARQLHDEEDQIGNDKFSESEVREDDVWEIEDVEIAR
jgi:hypothetical protein